MIDLSNISNIYITSVNYDFRKNIDGLVNVINSTFNMSIDDKTLFIFCSKCKSKIKVIHYEQGGVWMYYKRLNKDKFNISRDLDLCAITPQQLKWLLEGLTLFPKKIIEDNNYAINA